MKEWRETILLCASCGFPRGELILTPGLTLGTKLAVFSLSTTTLAKSAFLEGSLGTPGQTSQAPTGVCDCYNYYNSCL